MILRTPNYIFVEEANAETLQVANGLIRLTQIVGARTTSAAGTQGLSQLQSGILAMLTGRDSGVSVGFISRRFMISPATVSDSLRVLAGKGLIAKSRHESDTRAVMVTITESGRAVADRCSHGTKKLLRIVEGWDESRRAEALSLVFELIAGLQEEGKDFVDRMCAACRHFAINCDIEGGPAPYYCRSFGVPLKTVELRVDCPEFEPKGT